MPWRETRPGVYERPLDHLEATLKLVTDLFAQTHREHWAVNLSARLDFGDLSAERVAAELRRAWAQTRYHFPLIAAIVIGEVFVYDVPTEETLDEWVEASYASHGDISVDEFLRTATATTYASLHYFPRTAEVVIRTHHWQIDGIGALHLLDRFLTLLAAGDDVAPVFGDEWKRLPPSHTEAAQLPTARTAAREIAAQKYFDEHNPGNVPSIGLAMTPQTPAGTLRATRAFGVATCDAIIQACKRSGISVTSAIHAAIVVATQDHADPSTAQRGFTSLAFFDHRAHLEHPYDDARSWPMGCWMLAFPFTLPEADFDAHARALQRIYKQPIGVDECPMLDFYDAYTAKALHRLRQPAPYRAVPKPSPPQLSSLGVVDDKIRHQYRGKWIIGVEDVAPLLDVMTVPLLIFQWSWKGKTRMSACFNESYYARNHVEEYLERVHDVLLNGLKVNVAK